MQTTIQWIPIRKTDKILGHACVYYSTAAADYPVRDVRKRWDQKSDPNIETGTFGLFSTCMPPVRNKVVQQGESYLFFMTRWHEARMVTGYYELGSYIDTGLKARNRKFPWNFPDFALKAKRIHFVKDPIKLIGKTFSPLGNKVFRNNTMDGYGWRDSVRLTEEQTIALKDALDRQADISRKYIEEIHRLEDENEAETGYKYPIWKMKVRFTTELMKEFIKIDKE